MKKNNFKNLIALSLVLSMIASLNTFGANVVYSPGSNGGNTNNVSPLDDPSLKIGVGSNVVTPEQASVISSIVVQNNNTAAPVSSPDAFIMNDFSASPTGASMAATNPTGALTNANITTPAPSISAPTYILFNATTNRIYTSKNCDDHYDPAGLANLMTAYIATKYLKMDSILTVKREAVKGVDKDAAIAALDVGDKITLKDCLASMFVKGCVDSANVIATNICPSIEEFVKLMNATAKTLSLSNTYFTNPSGINDESQQSSARDMAIIMSKVCENNELIELLSLYQYELPKAVRRDKLLLYSKNSHLNKANSGYNADVVCSRMGYNKKANYCIASMMSYNGNRIFAIILKAQGTQFSDTKKLLEYGKLACAEDQK